MKNARGLFTAPLGALALAASGCGAIPIEPPPVPVSGESLQIALHYDRVVDQVEGMVNDEALIRAAQARGLTIMNLTWEDTGRAQGSALGPNISDLTLQVRRRDPWGRWADALMPVIRYPNFTDRTGDVPADRFFLRVGNERGGALRTEALSDVLRDLSRFVSAPGTMIGEGGKGARLDLTAERDTHYLVSAQAVFLPIPRKGKAEWNPVLFNYQSAPGSPAVLSILATREGTSVTVIDNRTEDKTIKGWGQELYFNDNGQRAAFTAERRSDVVARIAAQGGPRTEADRSALGKGADVLAIIQVPLRHKQMGPLGGYYPPSWSGIGEGEYAYEFSDDPLAAGGFGPNDATIRVRPGPVLIERSGTERAVLGHGAHLGPFLEGTGGELVRDPKFPVRITVQFYKATGDGLASEADIEAIARNIGSVYEHADFVGSLVVPQGDERRPTAWQSIPDEWFPW